MAGQYQNPVGIDISEEDVEYYGVEGEISSENDEDSRPIFESPDVLRESVQLDHANHGIEAFEKTIEVINDSLGVS